MHRSLLAIVAASMLAVGSDAEERSTVERVLSDHCARAQFVRMLYGTHPNMEVAAFIIDDGGTLTFTTWPRLMWVGGQTWRGAVPTHTIAVVHTHPPQKERPSIDDVRQASRLRIPFFIITSRAILLIETEPDVRVTRIIGEGWMDGVSKVLAEDCVRPRKTQPLLSAGSMTPESSHTAVALPPPSP